MNRKKSVLISFRKVHSNLNLRDKALLEVTSSVQIHTLLGYLKAKGFNVLSFEVFYNWPSEILYKEEIIEFLKEHQPDIFYISLLNVDFEAYRKFRLLAEKNLNKKAVWIAGGYLPTSIPQKTLKEGNFDFIVLSHGEYPLFLIEKYFKRNEGYISKIPNLVFNNSSYTNRRVNIYPEEEKNVKLHFSPFHPERYFKESWQIPATNKMIYLTTWLTRGCPYNCNFCLNKLMNNGIILKRPIEIVIEEILEMHEKYGVNFVFFADENFTANWKYSKKLLKKMVKEKFAQKGIRFTIMGDVKKILGAGESYMALLKEAGCEEIQFGVESGSPLMLKNMNKPIKIEQSFEAFELTNRYGISTAAMIVLGYEGETIQSLEETKKFIFNLAPDRMSLFFVIPLPGTKLYKSFENQLKDIPLYFFDSDFPILKINSLRKEIKEKLHPQNFYENNLLEIFRKNKLQFDNSQLYLIKFRRELMSEYYSSKVFLNKQVELFNKKVKIFKDDPNELIYSAKFWFQVLGESIGNKNLKNTILNELIKFANNSKEENRKCQSQKLLK